MAKCFQRARVILDGTDVSHLVTVANFEISGAGLTEVTVKLVGVTVDVDPETKLITVEVKS